jgi:hypothetical protein
VTVTVTPSGRVSRAEVAGDPVDPGVVDCLKATAASVVFSDNGGGPLRTYTIDVSATAH